MAVHIDIVGVRGDRPVARDAAQAMTVADRAAAAPVALDDMVLVEVDGAPASFKPPSGSLLRLVMAEQLARRAEAVFASSQQGHEFHGNQWTIGRVFNGAVESKSKGLHEIKEGSSHLEHGLAGGNGWRYDHAKKTVFWNYFVPSADEKEAVENHIARKFKHERLNHSSFWEFERQTVGASGPGGLAVMAKAHPDDTDRVAKAAVKDDDGNVLLLKDAQYGTWDLPGGHLLKGEGDEAGLVREVREETGLSVEVGKKREEREQGAVFDAAVAGVKPQVTLSEEHTNYKWVAEDVAPLLSAFWLSGGVATAPGPSEASFGTESGSKARFKAHDRIRNEAQREVSRAVRQVVALAEAEAVGKKKREDDSEFLAWCALVFAAAIAHAYGRAARKLATLARGADHSDVATKAEEDEFAASRAEFLQRFPQVARERIELEAKRGLAAGEADKEVAARVRAEGEAIIGGDGEVVAQTESQAIYGSGQLRALKRGGFATAVWDQLERPTKRDTHAVNAALGEKPLGFLYPNGQRYPGDPAGGPGECVNCLCYLVGVSRKPAEVKASAPFDESKHPRGQVDNKGEFGPGGGSGSSTAGAIAMIKEKFPERFGLPANHDKSVGTVAGYYEATGYSKPTDADGYLYHATHEGKLAAIKDHGLKPFESTTFGGYKSPDKVSLEPSMKDAEYWGSSAHWARHDKAARQGERPPTPVLLRVRKDNVETKMAARSSEVLADAVKPEHIEVWRGKWEKLA